ncbi:class I tRNA ligase family protein [Candidatus Saccharibacteria bacterium]|nr:class I tRNA ligase family protein [Candidatus Saccharibacteria bacterium]
MKRYSPKDIEPKWQQIWDETNTYTADLKSEKPKYIAMSMFNYPSGAGIHIGHAMNYTISDVKARFKRQQGYESYHPVGWDAFGLPAENYAIKAGVSPQESMATIIPSYHKQYKAMGWSNDWEKEIATHQPEYYKWTQWIFSEMYRNKLAYQDSRMQWWCEKCQTVLANEQIVDDKCWRHEGADDPTVEKKEVKQWFFKITEYADELLKAIDDLDWTESVKLAQKNWIGKSVGAEIDFKLDGNNEAVKVFTTRPDTLFGVTFMVVAPESDIVQKIVSEEQRAEVDAYIKLAALKSEVERQSAKEKTGVFSGAFAINPINNEKIPIWIADYVLAGYGTGAIMAVPAHDERDYEFAQKFQLPITQVIIPCEDDTNNPPRPEFEEVERDTVIVHLKDKSTGKYALLNWHESLEGITTAIMGGIEDGQTAEDAVRAEIAEEAGITDITITKKLKWVTAARYCASHKKQNRRAITQVFLAEVESLSDQTAIDESEQKIHTLVWVDESDVLNSLVPDHQKQVWQLLQNETALIGHGRLVNSGEFDGQESSEAGQKIVDSLLQEGRATEKVNYKMRDWSVSRQRYWGAPIPIVNCSDCGPVLLSDDALPVVLPELTDFQPSGDGRSALARAADWLKVDCPECGKPAERETDTLDTYICSSWYMYRYFDPRNQQKIFETDVVNKWAPIDFYNGGDHATAHLLYARFIARFFTKIGIVDNPEPFKQMLFNGKVMASDGSAFSKTKGNGPDPLEIINSGYGADALRTYLMFAAPLEFNSRWDSQGVPGTHRFLVRLWNLVQEYQDVESGEVSDSDKKSLLLATHKMIKKVTLDIEENRYNTAIAGIMGGLNDLHRLKNSTFVQCDEWQAALEAITACVAPFAPHIADELWQQLGHSSTVQHDSWPKYDEKHLTSDVVRIVVQVNGKVRDTVEVLAGSDEQVVADAAKQQEKVAGYITDTQIKKIIFVPNKLINFVV